jgi:transcription elongation factor GreB
MSKAFTRESDDELDLRPANRLASVLPEGTPNYLTADGAEQLKKELARLTNEDLPGLQQGGDDASRDQRWRMENRILEISETLNSAQIVSPPAKPWDQVSFGAMVTVRRPDHEEVTYRLVGVNEVDLDRNWVSWQAPVARALMNARIGQSVPVQLPAGRIELVVLNIAY